MAFKFHILVKILLIIVIVSGCARISETSKVIAGTSTRALYEARASGKSQIFNLDLKTCYDKTILMLKKKKAYIYLHSLKEKRIVAMNFKGFNNTTEVGIFFSEINPSSTKLEISCLSTPLLEYASQEIFSGFQDKKTSETIK